MCVCVCVCHMGHKGLTPNGWTTSTIFCEVASGQLGQSLCHPATYTNTHTHARTQLLILSHFPPLSLSLPLYSTTGRADGSPSARRARKSMWIKGYTQQVWRAASTVAVRQRGAPAHLPPRLGDIWLGFCGMMSAPPPTAATATAAGTTPKGEAVICSVFQLANEQMSGCPSVCCWSACEFASVRRCVCVCVCVCVHDHIRLEDRVRCRWWRCSGPHYFFFLVCVF